MTIDLQPFVDTIVAQLLGKLQPDEILDTRGAAALLLVSEDTVLRWAATGVIPSKKLDGRWRFRRSALLNHVTSQAQIQQ